MIKKGSIITIIFICSTFIQLVSQIIVTQLFGAKITLEVFLAAVTIPTIVVTVIYATLNDVFLPYYSEHKSKDPDHADRFFLSNLIALSFISFTVVWIFNFFSYPVSNFFFSGKGELFIGEVAIQMSYMMYGVPLAITATLFGSYFYLHKQFVRFPLAQAAGTVANLLLILLLIQPLGIWALVVAFVANILVQILFVTPRIFFSFQFTTVNIIPLLIMWIPLIVGSLAMRSDALLIRSLGSALPEGYLVYLNLIAKMFSLATGVMTVGVQVLLLPHLVEYIAAKNYPDAITMVNKSKAVAIVIAVVVAIMLTLIAPVIISLLFVGGKFTQHDALVTTSLLPFFVLPAIGWGVASIFFQPLIAIKKTLQLSILNVFSLALAWGVGTYLSEYISPIAGITGGLIILLFTGIIGSELLWQHYKKKLLE